jgi:hypothetical protein
MADATRGHLSRRLRAKWSRRSKEKEQAAEVNLPGQEAKQG